MELDHAGLDPDEPSTPTWFTFLGIALFLLGGIFALLKSASDDSSPSTAPSPDESEAAAAVDPTEAAAE